jgi:hypothetical protein
MGGLKPRRPSRVKKAKATPDRHWLMENSLNGKTLVDVETKGRPSKWLTFFARCVLRHFAG